MPVRRQANRRAHIEIDRVLVVIANRMAVPGDGEIHMVAIVRNCSGMMIRLRRAIVTMRVVPMRVSRRVPVRMTPQMNVWTRIVPGRLVNITASVRMRQCSTIGRERRKQQEASEKSHIYILVRNAGAGKTSVPRYGPTLSRGNGPSVHVHCGQRVLAERMVCSLLMKPARTITRPTVAAAPASHPSQ